jgi:type I restriction enzyme S subunit
MEAIKPTIGYKQTEIGSIPEDWDVVRLGDVFDMQQGKAMSPKNRLGISPQPFLRTVNVLWGHVDLSTLDYMDFTDEEITKLCLQPGDLLVCEGGEIGRTAMWRGEIKVCGYQNHIHRLRKQKQDIWSEFYMYWLQAAFLILGLYAGEGIRTTIPNLSRGRLKSFLVPKPPLHEQQKIATVLSTIQKAVEHQDKIIETTRKLKKSLLHRLFTEGLNGEEQKETEIGQVPKSWDVVRLGDVAKITMGQSPPSETYNAIGKGLPFLQGKAEFGEIYPTLVKYCSRPLKVASQEDILISVRAPVGDVNIAPIKCIIGRGLASIRITNGENLFLFYLLKFHKRKIEEEGTGSTFKAIRKSNLVTLKIPLPPLSEQQQIAHILSTVDKKIEIEERRKASLKELFKTMLHKLMSGEIRLKDVNI